MSKTYSYPVESYALITNLDKSVLKLNPVIECHGYQFIRVKLNELEKKFGDLFGLPLGFKSENSIALNIKGPIAPSPNTKLTKRAALDKKLKNKKGINHEEPPMIISLEFYDLLLNTVYNGLSILREQEIVILKRIKNITQHVVNGGTTFETIIPAVNEMTEFVRPLVQQLRLLKNGDVSCKTEFMIAADNRKVISRFNPIFFPPATNKFIITDTDVIKFAQWYKPGFKVNKLTDLAFSNFNISYDIVDAKAKFVTLMICLEALFKGGSGKIAHSISKNAATILSGDKAEYKINYRKVKNLYNVRSRIVHGDMLKVNMAIMLDELQDLVRKAINFSLNFDMSKDDFLTALDLKYTSLV